MILFLNLFYRPVYTLLKLILLSVTPTMTEKTKHWVELRRKSLDKLASAQPVFLFHASSGEIEYAKAMIRELKQHRPDVVIVVSYSSPSAIKLFENIKPFVDHFFPVPWDQPTAMRNFIELIHPEAVIFARTDLWPEFIYQLEKKNIKTFVISYYPQFGFISKFMMKILLKKFQAVFCVHPQQPELLKALLPASVTVAAPGDTRFDQVFWRLQQPSKMNFSLSFPYGVLGSTWSEDEVYTTSQLKLIKELNYKLVWAPHEIQPANIERIKKTILDQGLQFQMFSNLNSGAETFQADTDIILVDQVGYLADIYRHADWAFVGGSFKAKVHSVMEPLCCAIPIITGPYITNSPEALKYSHVTMNTLKVVQSVQTEGEFSQALQIIKNANKTDFKRLLIGNVESNRYATKKILGFILDKTLGTANS